MADESLNADAGIPRAEAIARYGSRWTLHRSDPPSVRETLAVPYGESGLLEDAEAKAVEVRGKSARWALAEAERILKSPFNRVAILLARVGLHRRSSQIMSAVAKHEATVERCRSELADTAWRPKREPLPEMVRLPRTLPIGTPVWEVGHEWPLEHGVRLRELRVAGLELYDFSRTEEWDYSVIHRLERITSGPGTPSSTPSFDAAPDGPCIPVPERTIPSSRLFLTREAAAAFMLEVAADLEMRVREARAAAEAAG